MTNSQPNSGKVAQRRSYTLSLNDTLTVYIKAATLIGYILTKIFFIVIVIHCHCHCHKNYGTIML